MTIKQLSFILLCLGFFCSACQPPKITITPAFYHWQTDLNLSPQEISYIKALSVQKIYPKCFDVDWNFNKNEPVALASLSLSSDLPIGMEIIPTIFITNRTLVHLEPSNLSNLVQQIVSKLTRQLDFFAQQKIREIQIDCDWTQSTQQSYFQLLALIKKDLISKNIRISATIRLHQIKYKNKTGIPPVSRGMLMYYNMGEVKDIKTTNSILNNSIGQSYLAKASEYPLPLDIALPLFQWGVLFRNGRMIKLINQLDAKELSDSQRFGKLDKNHWEIIKSTYLNGIYLYKGDQIRLEKVELADLIIATQLLKKQLKKENRSIVFYHLDSTIVQQFDAIALRQIVQSFTN